MIGFRVLSEFRRACHLLVVAGTIVFAFVGPGVVRAEFSASNFKRIWAEEFGAGAVEAQPAAQPAKPQAANAGFRSVPVQAHPAVARIVVPEGEATSFGSGTLVDVRDGYGIVVTNWHVVKDAQGPIEVIFPNGFTSKARALKVDEDWDLAALVVYEPGVMPVKIADVAPQPGDPLTICGYGPGIYRSATGRCTQYYSPREHLPQQMVELNVEARQGDSGGPIFNSRGELAGVLFGAGGGTTLGSFNGRVDEFLTSLAPDIGRESQTSLVSTQTESGRAILNDASLNDKSAWQSTQPQRTEERPVPVDLLEPPSFSDSHSNNQLAAPIAQADLPAAEFTTPMNGMNQVSDEGPLFEKMKSGLAALGLFAIVVMFLKAAG